MSKTADSVDLLIQEFRPDIVMVDGMYLMGVSGKKFNNNSDRVSAVLDTLKESTLARNVPIIGTSQFNRIAGKKGKDGSLETVAYSDAISTHSSIVASIHEGLTGREAKTRRFELIKGREGESGTFYYRYEFRPVNLEEIDEDEEAGVIDADGNVLDWTV
jgi:5,10-methenyltetrahydromethanopterin hydrogenase